MNSTFEAFINFAKVSNIDMDGLFAYYKAKIEETKLEEVDTKKVTTVEKKKSWADYEYEDEDERNLLKVKLEEAKLEEVDTKKVTIVEKKNYWSDDEEVDTKKVTIVEKKNYWSDDEEVDTKKMTIVEKKNYWSDDERNLLKVKLEETKVKVTEVKSYKDILSPNSSDKTKLNKTYSSSSDEWETFPTEDEFIKVSKKHIYNKNILVVNSLEEFIDCIKEKKKPNIDFVIHDTAHCSHTFEGTLCKNVRYCKKIHIQRCISGEICKNKYCPYLHIFDMPDNESKISFNDSMSLYNQIKPKKQVRY